MKRPEQLIQQGVFSYLTPLMFLQKYSQFVAFQIRNESGVRGDKGAMMGKIAKSMGMMSGASDTVFLFPKSSREALDFSRPTATPSGVFYPIGTANLPPKTVFVEFKAFRELKTKTIPLVDYLSESQKAFKNIVEEMGFEYRIIVAKNINEAVEQVKNLLMENGVSV